MGQDWNSIYLEFSNNCESDHSKVGGVVDTNHRK